MSVKIWDSSAGAWKDAESVKIWDNENSAHRDSTGLVFDTAAEAWKEKWTPFPDKVYLYNRGNECVDVTGGWTGTTVLVEGNAWNNEYYKNNDHLYLRSYDYKFFPVFFTGQSGSNASPVYIPKGYKVGILADWEISFYQENYSEKPNTGLFEFGFVPADNGGNIRYFIQPTWMLKNQTNIWANIGNYQHTVSASFGPSVLYTAPSTEDINGYFRFSVKYSSGRSTRDTNIYLKVYEVWIEKV